MKVACLPIYVLNMYIYNYIHTLQCFDQVNHLLEIIFRCDFFHTTVGSYNNNLVTLNLLNHREYRNWHADVENNSAHFNIDVVSLCSSKLT